MKPQRLTSRRLTAAAVLASALLGAAGAVEPDEVLPDPALEARAREISRELRCVVCQNQSIDDSDAPLARDLRLLVRERLVAGDSDREVVDFVVARYGDYVLLKPRLDTRTALLWSAPLLLFAAGAAVAVGYARRRARAAAPSLSKDEEDEVARILGEGR